MNKNIFQDPEILNSPSYLITEQIFNAITHGAGLILAIIGTIYLTSESYHLPGVLPFVSYLIFGLSMIWMYLMSTLYHSLYFTKVKPIFQFFDHSSIFILIAGSFTPFALVMVGGWLGWTIFAVQWLVAIVGISAKMLNHAWIRKYSNRCLFDDGMVGAFTHSYHYPPVTYPRHRIISVRWRNVHHRYAILFTERPIYLFPRHLALFCHARFDRNFHCRMFNLMI